MHQRKPTHQSGSVTGPCPFAARATALLAAREGSHATPSLNRIPQPHAGSTCRGRAHGAVLLMGTGCKSLHLHLETAIRGGGALRERGREWRVVNGRKALEKFCASPTARTLRGASSRDIRDQTHYDRPDTTGRCRMIEDSQSSAGKRGRDLFARAPADAALEIEKLPADIAAEVLADQPPDLAVPVWERLSPDIACELLARVPTHNVVAVLNRTDPTRAAGILVMFEPQDRERYLDLLDKGIARDLRLILQYPPGSAGSLMDPRVVYLRRDMLVSEALGRLRLSGARLRPVRARRILVIVDGENRIEGIVEIQDLVFAQPEDRLGEFLQPIPAYVTATDGNEEVVSVMEEHRLSSIPVVDSDGRLIGLIRYDELVAAAKEQATADMQMLFGVSRDERALSGPGTAVRKRLPWLQINLLTAFMAAAVVGLFEGTIEKFTALAVLLPVVAGQSGNTGAQALAVMIRGLALREVHMSHWRRVLWKELQVGIVNGLAIAATTCIGTFVWSRSLALTTIIGLAMVLSMVIACLSGACVPLVLTALKQDPAQSASIVLTTVTDIMGFFSFLGIAAVFIHLGALG
jgi:magnesium transporter